MIKIHIRIKKDFWMIKKSQVMQNTLLNLMILGVAVVKRQLSDQ